MLQGSIVALITAMDQHGQIDYVAMRRLLDLHIDAGSKAIVIAGTTGESATLSRLEYEQLVSFAVKQVAARIPVLAGTGGADTARVIEQTTIAADAGADAALVVTPYYIRPMQTGLLAHYHALADTTPIPLVLYNVPSRTAVDMVPETVAELAGREEIIAIKEALPDADRIRRLVTVCDAGFIVLSGDDSSCVEAMRAGAKGVISVAANVVPRLYSEMCFHANNGDWQAVTEIDDKLRPLYKLLSLETNPIPVKWALYKMALAGCGIRLPLLALDEKYHETFALGMNRLGLA